MNPTLRTFLQPYSTMHKGMVINWHREESSDTVYYRVEGTSEWATQPSTTKNFPHRNETIHRAILNSLQEGTAYEFRFEGEGEGDIRKFKVPPRNEPENFRISILSDHQQLNSIDNAVFRSITSMIAAYDSDLVIFNGDTIQCWGSESSGAQNSWALFLTIMGGDMVNTEGYMIPMVFAIGNHDLWPYTLTGRDMWEPEVPPNNHLRFFHTLWDDTDHNYHYGYGHLTCGDWLLLIFVSTDHTVRMSTQIPFLEGLYARFGNRFKYVLPVQHIIPYPPYRALGTSEVSRLLKVDAHRIYQKFGVKFISSAHDHVWCITEPIFIAENVYDVTESDSQVVQPDNPQSIRYVGSGACHSSTLRQPGSGNRWWIDEMAGVQNFWYIDFGSGAMEATGIDHHGTVRRDAENMTVKMIPYNTNSLNAGGGD